jgi:uncharacterized 2Fe-2S/4Fe-4S cluster protein (DUF4445 family)
MNYDVQLLPESRSVSVPNGTTLQDALVMLDVSVIAPCGGEGLCGKCRVELLAGEVSPITATERALFTSEQVMANMRLSCRAQVCGDVQVCVPKTSRTPEMRVVLGGVSRKVPAEPAVVKVAVAMSAQTLDEPYARLEHLRKCGGLRSDLKTDSFAAAP